MQKLVYIIFTIITLCGIVVGSCGSDASLSADDTAVVEDVNAAMTALDAYIADTGGRWNTGYDMPDDGCIKLRVDYPGGTLRSLFNDSNYVHYAEAQALGIEPIVDEQTARNIRRPLDRIVSNKYYKVDNLTHSYPYLVPESHALLDTIGKRFHDTLQARGGGGYRLKVTSMLRTDYNIHRLRRVNRASVDSSAHRFGTTFDISFTNFIYDSIEPHRTQEDLKNLLAEILYGLHNEGRCYIKYEHRPGCFHITARRTK